MPEVYEGPPAGEVQRMFDRITPRYDLLNRVISFGLDGPLRTHAAQALRPTTGRTYVDLGCGTGDLLLRVKREAPGAVVLGFDLSRGMLEKASKKDSLLPLVQSDALHLPLRDSSVDGATSAFVLRNVSDLDAFFREVHRILGKGGRFSALEITRPQGGIFSWMYRFYFFRIVPLLGRVAGEAEAYAYLARSVEEFEEPESVARRLRIAGFSSVEVRRLLAGAATLFVATK